MWQPYKGLEDWQIRDVPGQRPRRGTTIDDVRPVLQKVEAITGVPWQAQAGYWTRESFSVAAPKTPGGPFQLDPIPSPGFLRGLLDRFTILEDDDKLQLLQLGVNQFYAGAVFAACKFRIRANQVITPTCSDEAIKDGFWGYNGRAKYHGSADGSAYVMNGFDEAHWHMRLVGTEPDGHGGRRKVDFLDERPGAYVVYKQLKELYP